ncbi:MAG: hypothetical protein AAGL98_07860 [Planctomycetota bacterium]
MGWTGNNSDTACPFINGEDHRCGKRLTLGRLDQAFAYCLGGYLACPTYHQLSWETQPLESSADQTESTRQSPPPRRLTLVGQADPGRALVGLTLRGRARRDPARRTESA